MSQYKELADRLDRSTRHDAYMHAVIAKAIAILRSLDEQPVAEVMVMGSYRGKPILGCVLHSDSAKVGDKLYAAPVAAQPQQAKPLSDEEIAFCIFESKLKNPAITRDGTTSIRIARAAIAAFCQKNGIKEQG